MKLQLKLLKPNPVRDFKIDPIDQDAVAMLRRSIQEYSFWGGTVVRKNKNNGTYETAAGYTRILAAIEEGVEEADICVADFNDHQMVRAYITENATQRGNIGAAVTGAVATSIMEIARLLISDPEHLARILARSSKAIETAQGNLMNGHGVGHDLIEAFLKGVPGITTYIVQEQIATLKSSGHYQRLITQIAEEAEAASANETEEVEQLEKEAEEASTVKEKEATQRKLNKKQRYRARKTAKNVEKSTPTFDLEGVSKHLKNTSHRAAFRKAVESAAVRPVLPVENQAALAKEIVNKAKGGNQELTGEFIKTMIGIMVGDAKFKATHATKKQLEEAFKTRVRDDFARRTHHFARQVGGICGDELLIRELVQNNPTIEFQLSYEFKESIGRAQASLDELRQIFPELKKK